MNTFKKSNASQIYYARAESNKVDDFVFIKRNNSKPKDFETRFSENSSCEFIEFHLIIETKIGGVEEHFHVKYGSGGFRLKY